MKQDNTIIKYITHNKHIALAIIVSVMCICTGTLFSVPAQAASSGPDIVPGEIIVVCNPDADAESLQELDELLEEEYAVEEVEPLAEAVGEDGAGMLLRMENKSDVVEAVGKMNQQDAVAYAQPNFRYQMMDSTEDSTEAGEHSDPYREYQYYLNAWDNNFQTSCGANVAGAWGLMGGIAEGGNSSTREPVTIAVLDSGCQIQHEDLRDNIDAEHAYDAVHLKQGSDQVKDGSEAKD